MTWEKETLARRVEILELIRKSMQEGLTPEEEARHLEILSDYIVDDEPAEPSWQMQVIAARAEVDQAWAEVGHYGSSQFITLPRELKNAEEIGEWMEARAAAPQRYEQAVIRVGEILGAEADRRAAERLHEVEPEDLVTHDDLLLLYGETKVAQRACKRAVTAEASFTAVADYRAAVARYNEAVDKFNTQQKRVTAMGAMRAQVYREVIGEVRQLGGARPATRGRPNATSVAQLGAVADDMPAEWVETADRHSRRPLALSRRKDARASYNPGEDKIVTAGSASDMAHEYGHVIEQHVPSIHVATNEFLRRRTTDADGNREPEKHMGKGYRSDERTRPDGFVTSYIGKTYPGEPTEVFSVGTEAIFTGTHGGLVGDHDHPADLEHRNLILGLWASAPGQPD